MNGEHEEAYMRIRATNLLYILSHLGDVQIVVLCSVVKVVQLSVQICNGAIHIRIAKVVAKL